MRIVVTDVARSNVEHEIGNAGRLETGGLLLGWRRPDLETIVVADATGPGRRARRSRHGLILDTADLQDAVDRAFAASCGDVGYLGDWHVHHSSEPVASPIDAATARSIATDPNVAVPEPVLLIVGRAGDGDLQWRGWVGRELLSAHVEFA
ncbi:MAG: Mov34/MPN/PAD-1 family protein [Acidimicrobiales bacterium]